ncbi:GtrA family protein [Plantactinospora sp. BB1]|uniref:GtrA family protein n=1 Tax=Plantactinospora sp. BB1 TaxID=2071627 RepID=UPI000D171BD4|nr:GtrA family protein [Plantactinospora sp. BB1]AVT36739.1 polysaccharide synthesis protein GtrA [Plantactinospora sp. BB1]
MRFARLLPERWQKFLREVLKFGAVGGLNAAINYAVFNALALTVFADGQLKANVIATVVATVSSYLMNRHWTYRDRPKSAMRREYALFFLFNGAGLAIELGVLAVAKYGFGISSLLALNVAKTVGVGLATIFRFWSYRTFVFRKSPNRSFVPVEDGAAGGTTASKRTAELDDDFLAELDPVAELAEAVGELTEPDTAGPQPAGVAGGGQGAGPETGVPDHAATPAANGRRTAAGTPDASAQPLEVQFAETIDAALETELAAELNAAPRRSSAR